MIKCGLKINIAQVCMGGKILHSWVPLAITRTRTPLLKETNSAYLRNLFYDGLNNAMQVFISLC